MRRQLSIIFLLLFLFAAPVGARTWFYSPITIAWDPVALVDPTDQPNKYMVYIRNNLQSAGVPVGRETLATQMKIYLSTSGLRYFGVKTVRYPAGATVGILSEKTSWSNISADTGNKIFWIYVLCSDSRGRCVYYVYP